MILKNWTFAENANILGERKEKKTPTNTNNQNNQKINTFEVYSTLANLDFCQQTSSKMAAVENSE